MSNYMDYRDLATSVHNQIKKRSPSFRFFKFCVDPMQEKISDFPAILTYWENSETISEPKYNAQRIDLRRRATMVSIIRVKSSTQDAAFQLLMNLLLQAKAAMIGFQPVISDAYNVWPIYPIDEEFFEISGGELGVMIVWAVDFQEIAEVTSALFS